MDTIAIRAGTTGRQAMSSYRSRTWDPQTLAVIAAGLSVAMALYAMYLWLRAKGTWSWRPVDGQITTSTTEERNTYRRGALWRKKVPIYRPSVTYIYSVAGTDHEGTRIFFGDGAWDTSRDAVTAILDRYPPGKHVKVYSSPSSPKESVLERGQQKGTLRHLMTALQLMGGALAFWLLSKALA